jgi:hypothetical protein
MKNIKLLSSLILLFVITACSSSTKQESLEIKKVGNYPYITWTKGKMLLSKNDKYLFVVNNRTPNQIDILDVRNLTEPKFFKKIIVSNKKENFIAEYKLSKDKNYLYTANYIDGKILVYDIQNINNIKKIKEIPIQKLSSFVPNGKYLYVSGCIDSKYCDFLNIYDLDKNKYVAKSDIKGIVTLDISPNRKRLFYGISPSRTERIGLANISNPLDIKVLDETGKIFNNRGNFSTSAGIEDVVFGLSSSKLYIAGNKVGLMIYNISKNKLENIQLTSGTHSKMFANSTESIYSLSINKNTNQLYLAGLLDNNYKQIKSIKGVKRTLLLNGEKIIVSNRSDFLIVGNSNGLDFYTNLK